MNNFLKNINNISYKLKKSKITFYKNSDNIVGGLIYNTAIKYPSPTSLSYFWNFGILALLCLVSQVVTGLALVFHYCPHVDYAFLSVESIMRDVNWGWLIRYLHLNGASFFFITVYFHLFRGLYYGSYVFPRHLLWISGVIILFLMIVIAFMGYVLPWGQMSFWGATVITNLFSAIPYVGTDIVYWLWGGFSVDNPTLNRFFGLHFFLPFILIVIVILHLFFLHKHGSNNPLGLKSINIDSIPFTPYFIIKDLVGIIVALILFLFLVFFMPNLTGHPTNYIPANPLNTPALIVPEWYFSSFYAILRSIPNKLAGVLALLLSIFVLFFLSFIGHSTLRSSDFRPFYKFLFYVFFIDSILLCWIGSQPVEYPYVTLGRFLTFIYFFIFFFFLPLVVFFESYFFNYYNKFNY
jgi:quinol-cytochrome oxidoreductase complex cytochrome b subunit